MRKKFLVIFPLSIIVIVAFVLYKNSLHESTYFGLPTVPCFDTTLSIKQNYSITIKMLVDGKPYPLDATIGHDYGKCLHAIYVNDASGKIYVKANDTNMYTLGQFFDVWRKTFTNYQMGDYVTSSTKKIHVLINDKLAREKNIRDIPLSANTTIVIICGEQS